MHCVRDAAQGGGNLLLDPELVYIALRDQDPAYVAVLMQPDAMTIPANQEEGAELRAAQPGPVLSVDRLDGTLHMRYTARKRSIEWRSDALTREAVGFLETMLAASNPHVLYNRLTPGQGLVCNNVLHTREGFVDGATPGGGRLLLRARFFERVAVP
jgi:hypothetical protein